MRELQEAYGWGAVEFAGSRKGLRYALEELPDLDRAVSRVKNRIICLQAGGSLGIFPKRLAQKFSVVYTFEPDAESFGALCRNCPEENVHKFQAALGVDRGLLVTVERSRRDGKPETHEGTRFIGRDEPGDVVMFRIDDLGFRRLDFLCLDIEGSENEALWGAEETLRRLRPALMLEVNKQSELAGVRIDTLLSTVEAFGYLEVEVMGSNRVFVSGRK